MAISKTNRRLRIRRGIRNKISGTADRPRLSVYRSNKSIYAQLIDDATGRTLVATNTVEVGQSSVNIEASKSVGKKLAEKAAESGISSVVFDRGGYPYHGNVKALAEGAREGGLKF
ncbi:50S ribosomal protein L18 [Reichenbachiella sp. MALMAid0571]|uniref:50S ribosomal protein L18 n=1 Tax=Reichenbachiella sp. MALMAid0571 TaxID=3143939 RepID=UPI0032DF7CE7